MNNHSKPAWMLFGVLLVTLLWALEFDNRPGTRLAVLYPSDPLSSSTIDVAVVHSDHGLKPDTHAASMDRLAHSGKSEKNNHLQGDRLLSHWRLWVDSANRQLPVQEQVFYTPGTEPLRDNNPLHAADRLYNCFGNHCLDIIDDQ